jgi:hypothetical protein
MHDQVAIVRGGSGPHRTVTVRVWRAKEILRTTNSVTQWPGCPWRSAARIDGRAGAELVVASLAGAHYEQLRVVTYRKGLVRGLRRFA